MRAKLRLLIVDLWKHGNHAVAGERHRNITPAEIARDIVRPLTVEDVVEPVVVAPRY